MADSQGKNTQNYLPILHARSKNYFWKGKGALSIKTFMNGRAFYQAGHGHFAVNEGNYLLLNHGQEYSITIESDTRVESFCIFFPEMMVEEVYHSLVASDEKLLDDPFSSRPNTMDFVEKTYRNDDLLAPALFQIRAEHINKQSDQNWIEEKLLELSQRLLQVHRQVIRDMMKLQSLKAATRAELFKRVHLGHDYISAYYNQPITLKDIAGAACLSPNHFLRSFKQLFGMTPHQFLSEVRLQEAKRLLFTTDKPITDICLEVGLQSPSSFSGSFSKRFALSPSQFRQKR